MRLPSMYLDCVPNQLHYIWMRTIKMNKNNHGKEKPYLLGQVNEKRQLIITQNYK